MSTVKMFGKKHPHKRKYKFIDKKQQLRFAVDIALHSLLFPTFYLLLNILPPISTWLLGKDEELVRPVMKQFFRIAADHWPVLILSLIFVGFFSVLFSHRIFGPIRRFENALRERIQNPDSHARCNLRTGDYFQDFSVLLEDALNVRPSPTAAKSEPSSENNQVVNS